MHRLLIDIPTRVETERLYIRCYQPGDGKWYYAIGQKNREHLARYEAGNSILSSRNEEEAEIMIRSLVLDWMARKSFLMGVFDKKTDEFVAQIYVGPVDWDLPEFELGYIADVDHEGRGYVTEAAQAMLRILFEQLGAWRVRLECDDTNLRSARVAERCGMQQEGHLRQNKKNPDGSISGTLLYGLLRTEYHQRLPKTWY